jgi:hypothetical protein
VHGISNPNPMKKLFILFVLLSFSQVSFAQEKVKLEVVYQPNHQYDMGTKSITNMTMDAQLDEATKTQMSAAGMSFPLKMLMTQETVISQKTGAPNAQKEIPVTMEYVKYDTKQTMGGKEMPTAANPLQGVKISGLIGADNKLRLDEMADGQLDENIKQVMLKAMDQLQTSILFPKDPMKIGEQFEQIVPFEMPVQGASIKMTTKTLYKLISIKNGMANFDMVQEIKMDMNMDNGGMSADGAGTGKMVFDIKKKFMSTYNSSVDMEMLIKAGTMDMSMKMNTITDVTITHP